MDIIKNYRIKASNRENMLDEAALIQGIKAGHYKGNEKIKLLGEEDAWRLLKTDPKFSEYFKDKSQRVVSTPISSNITQKEEELMFRAPDDAVSALRPLRMGQLLDRIFYLFKSRFWKNMKLVLYIQIFVYLTNQLIKFGGIYFLGATLYDYNTLSIFTSIPAAIISSLAYLLISAAVINATRAQLFGVDLTSSEAYKEGRSCILPLLGTGIIAGLFVLFGMVVFIIPGIILAFSYMLFQVVVVLEKRSGMSALTRSTRLMRVKFSKGAAGRNTWRVFILILVNYFITGTIYGILMMPRLIFTAVMGMNNYLTATSTTELFNTQLKMAPFEFIESVGFSAVLPFLLIGFTVLYYDTRIRTEGLDLYIGSKKIS